MRAERGLRLERSGACAHSRRCSSRPRTKLACRGRGGTHTRAHTHTPDKMGDAGENDADYTPEHTVRKRKRKAKPKAGSTSKQAGGFGSPARDAKLAKKPAAAKPEDEK